MRNMQHLASYFYAYGGIIVLTWETRIQRDFDTLTELFDRLGLHTNVAKTVIMECQPYRALRGNLAEAYRIRTTGEGHYFWYRIIQRVRCPNCDVDQPMGLLEARQQGQHGVARGS